MHERATESVPPSPHEHFPTTTDNLHKTHPSTLDRQDQLAYFSVFIPPQPRSFSAHSWWVGRSGTCLGGAMDGLWTEVCGQQKQSNDPSNNQHILNTPITGRR